MTAVVILASALPVEAELNDPPYFNLWSTGSTGSNGLLGNGTSVSLCGGSACTADQFATFRVFNGQPAGTGYIDPFLRFQHNNPPGTNGTTEAAYNTDARPLQNDGNFVNQAKDENQWNHSLMLGALDGADGFYHFFLDINEPGGSKGTLRLDELQFFVGSSNTLNSYSKDKNGENGANEATGALAGATKVWDMDWNSVTGASGTKLGSELIGGLNLDSVNEVGCCNGSGDYDLEVLLPTSLFAGFADTDYVYLYNFAGEADPKTIDEAQAGFEEWAVAMGGAPPPPPGVPEPLSAALLGGGLLGLMGVKRRSAKSS